MKNAKRLAGVLVFAIAISAPALVYAQQPDAAGRVKVVSGTAFIVRNGAQTAAKAGDAVFESDVLRTGSDGRLGVTLKDDTRVSLGPTSEVRLDKFTYAPTEGNLALALRVVRGVAAYVSGRIAKLSPDAVHLETPAAIVGVRGTTLAIRAGA